MDMREDAEPSDKHSDLPFPINKNSELLTSSEENYDETTAISDADMQTESSDIPRQTVTETAWELIQASDKSLKLLTHLPIKSIKESANARALKISALGFRDDQVRVVIHNLTQLTEDDVQKRGNAGIAMSGTLYDEDINEKMWVNERTISVLHASRILCGI